MDAELLEELRGLARDVAEELVPWQNVIAAHGVEEMDFVTLLNEPAFRELMLQEKAKWLSPENTGERVRKKSLYCVEDGLLALAGMVNDVDIHPSMRIKAYAELVRVGGADNVVAQRAKQAGGTEGRESFAISIHIGGGEESIRALDANAPIPALEVDAAPQSYVGEA